MGNHSIRKASLHLSASHKEAIAKAHLGKLHWTGVPHCKICGAELTEKNWPKFLKKDRSRRCSKCESERNKKYQKSTRVLATIDGKKKVLRGNKRTRPSSGLCELCGKERAKDYHHWDDEDISKGIWVCWRDHRRIEFMEHIEEMLVLVPRWREIKRKIEKGEL